MRGILTSFVLFWDDVVIWYFVVLNLFYGFLFLMSVGETWKNWMLATRLHLSARFDRETLPPISIIIPAYNEAVTILDTLEAQLALEYPHLEVIVVNDGSEDETFDAIQRAYELYEVPPAFVRKLETREVRGYYRSRHHPALLVIDKENGGKADALNAGLNAARYPLCATVDADTIIAHDALPRIVRPFLMEDHVAGAGGTIRVANACRFERGVAVDPQVPKRYLAGVQVPEYLRAFLFGRLGWNRLGGNILVSGAFALFRRDLLMETGGYPVKSVTEDLDLTVGLHRALRERGLEYSLPFVPDPVAWTEVPEDVGSLGRQRERWHRGLIRTLLRNARMLVNPRYGRIGVLAFPFFTFGEMMAPVVEVIGYAVVLLGIWLHLLNWDYALLFAALSLGYMMMLSVWAVMLEEFTYRVYPRMWDFFRLILYALLEPFGYRQLTLYWRLKAFWKALIQDRSWGRQKRQDRNDRRPGPERGEDRRRVAVVR
ncbi:MAG: glycosyltransferase [Gemmatimonadota bacterium]